MPALKLLMNINLFICLRMKGKHTRFLSQVQAQEHLLLLMPQLVTVNVPVPVPATGTFTVTNATISGNNITQTQVFSDISVTPSLLGSISLSNDSDTALSLDTDG